MPCRNHVITCSIYLSKSISAFINVTMRSRLIWLAGFIYLWTFRSSAMDRPFLLKQSKFCLIAFILQPAIKIIVGCLSISLNHKNISNYYYIISCSEQHEIKYINLTSEKKIGKGSLELLKKYVLRFSFLYLLRIFVLRGDFSLKGGFYPYVLF